MLDWQSAKQSLSNSLADVTAYFSPFPSSSSPLDSISPTSSTDSNAARMMPGYADGHVPQPNGSSSSTPSRVNSPSLSGSHHGTFGHHHHHDSPSSHHANGSSSKLGPGGASTSNSGGSHSQRHNAPGSTASSRIPASTSMSIPEHNRLLAEMAPHIMRPRILSAAIAAGNNMSANVSNSALIGFLPLTRTGLGGYTLAHPARSLVRLGNTIRQGPVTSKDIKALESSYQILANVASGSAEDEIVEPKGIAKDVSLLRGFQASLPSRLDGRNRRRKQRGRNGEHLGLRKMASDSQGLLGSSTDTGDISIDDVDPSEAHHGPHGKEKRKARRTAAAKSKSESALSIEELQTQVDEIVVEKEDINIRRMLVNSEIAEVEARIAALELVKQGLGKNLTSLREEELELNDEYDGVSEMIAVMKHRRSMPGGERGEATRNASGGVTSSRRRKGPLFLPSEHDELPPGVAFMTLTDHVAPITALDFSEPYGTLVSAALDDTVRVWDLATGSEVGRLRGHTETVKCMQVEDELCITGSGDSTIKLWDLRRVDDFETRLSMREEDAANGIIRDSDSNEGKDYDPCLRTLDGHSKAVTSLYFDDTCLVSGASDKTLRQWDLNTGQCVLTMDILWAISNPSASQSLISESQPELSSSSSPIRSRHTIASSSPLPPSSPSRNTSNSLLAEKSFAGAFSCPTPAYADGSWEMYQDFVGGVQFWGYALASGSGDGAVRMWDMRTGQAHRTLFGHTGPVTCLQFDETHVVSGSLDKSIRIWDLRTGAISDTIRYDYPVTALQFDSRKIMAATGENQLKIFNRTSMQHRTLSLNGHTAPAERLRYMDRYAVTGGKDNALKVWAL